MKKILTLLLLVLLIGTFAFAGGQQEAAEADAGSSEVVVDEWEIPFLNCLTGPIASIGEYLQWGAEFAAEQINAEGGIAGKPVRVIGVDTE